MEQPLRVGAIAVFWTGIAAVLFYYLHVLRPVAERPQFHRTGNCTFPLGKDKPNPSGFGTRARHGWAVLILLLALVVATLPARGQCPVSACTPGGAPASALSFGMGIYRVQLASLDTTTNGAADGYRDYSCGTGAALQRGATYTLAVRTNPNADETVRAWVDFDDNGQFTASELVLASTARQHQVSFSVPTTAITGRTLRLRIAADYVNAPVPTACSTPQYSQTEDYRVVISTAPPPRPQARFAAADTVTCSGPIVFRDHSLNTPTAWRWVFGDGTSSTQQHPQHTYAGPGVYAVQLRVCNASGCDSLARPNYIRVRADAPRPAPCQPPTLAYCCGFGLTRFQLGTLNHPSADGAAGSEDFSCAQRTTLTADRPYTLQLTTGANAHDVRLYLDRNDNGQFDLPSELLYEGLSVRNPVVVVQVPASAGLVYNRPLRLRCWVDAVGTAPFGPCVSPQRGQVEDYTVLVLANAAAPTAQFSLNYEQLCGPVRVGLANTTTGGATSYSWNFGDGSTSSAATPAAHTYATGGTYEIRLIARNAFGADTTRQLVAVAGNCPAYCPATGQGGSATTAAYFTRVQLTTLDNQLPRGPGGPGYHNFTTTQPVARLTVGQADTLRTESPPFFFNGSGPWAQVTAWVDFNQDGNFTREERIGDQLAFSPHVLPFRVPSTAYVGATRLRLVITRPPGPTNPPTTSCPAAGQTGTTEDYSVLLLPAAVAPRAGFAVDLTPSCSGLVQFRDTSAYTPTSWSWHFGDGGVSTQQHPQHTYLTPGTYAVSLHATNRYGTHTVARTTAVTVNQVGGGVRPAACQPLPGPPSANWLSFFYVDRVTVGAWTYTNPLRDTPYVDETCGTTVIPLTIGQALSFTHRVVNNYPMHVKVWLDCNDDGQFNSATELLYSSFGSPSTINPKNATLTIPANTLPNQPLRMRVWWMTDAGTPAIDASSCFRDEMKGQVRDFKAIATTLLSAVPTSKNTTPEFLVFPNPATNALYISSEQRVLQPIRLLDCVGKEIFSEVIELIPQQPHPLDIKHLPRGLYWLDFLGIPNRKRIILY